jgi:hypothetical protein
MRELAPFPLQQGVYDVEEEAETTTTEVNESKEETIQNEETSPKQQEQDAQTPKRPTQTERTGKHPDVEKCRLQMERECQLEEERQRRDLTGRIPPAWTEYVERYPARDAFRNNEDVRIEMSWADSSEIVTHIEGPAKTGESALKRMSIGEGRYGMDITDGNGNAQYHSAIREGWRYTNRENKWGSATISIEVRGERQQQREQTQKEAEGRRAE